MYVEGEDEEGRSRSSSDGNGNDIEAMVSRMGKSSPVTGGDAVVGVVGRDYSRTSDAGHDIDLEGEGEESGRGFNRNTSSSSATLGDKYLHQPTAGVTVADSSKEPINKHTQACIHNNTNTTTPLPLPVPDYNTTSPSSLHLPSHKDHFILSWSALQQLNWDIIFLLGPLSYIHTNTYTLSLHTHIHLY